MGNVCSCGRASSTSDSDAQYQQLLGDLRTNPDISSDNLDSLMDCMDFIFSKLKQPNEASSSSSSERVAQSAEIGRSIVRTLSTQIESEVTATTSKCTYIGRICASKMKRFMRAALDSRTMKLVGDVLDKTQNIPYIGVAGCIVVYLLEQYEKYSSNAEETMKLLEHLYFLAKRLKDFRPDENANKLQDMLVFIVKCTVSLAKRINRSPIESFAFAYPDSTELQSMRDELMFKYQDIQLDILMDIYKNIPRLSQAPSKVHCDSDAVGIESAMEEVKKKLNMGEASKKVVIIWGIGGSGKTTLGDHVYNSVVDKSKFSHCSLEMDIKSTNVPKLQFDLLNQVFKENQKVRNAKEGRGRISKAIEQSSKQSKSKPLFLYIDNASIKDEVENLLPIRTLTSLPEGSKIMVTTRNLKTVETWKDISGFKCETFRMEGIPGFKAKKILSYYALKDENGSFGEDVDVDGLLNLCMGIPLLIKMAAKLLRKLNIERSMGMAEACRNAIEHMQSLKNKGNWEKEATDRMVDFVYGQLSEDNQTMFLDIVFFFFNWRRYKVVCIFGEVDIGELEDAGLLSTNQEGRLKVHDIIKGRAQAISNGSRICDREAWELLKTNAQDFNSIVGLHINVEEKDLEYVSKCDKIKILILEMRTSQGAVKVHLPTSVEILCLKGPFIHNENLRNAFKVLIMKRNEFEKGFTSYQIFTKVQYLDMVNCKGIDIPTCFSHVPSSCKRLSLSDAELEMLPHGNDKVPYTLESLKLDGCRNIRILPDIFIQRCPLIKIASMRYCGSLHALPDSFGQLQKLEKLDMSNCISLGSLCGNFGSLSKLRELDISSCQSLRSLPPSFGLLQNLEKLNMRDCESLESLGEKFGGLSKLEELEIRDCESLQSLPPSFGQLENLEKLKLDECKSLKTLGENFGRLSKLKKLEIEGCDSLETLSPSFGLLKNLEKLRISKCPRLKSLGGNSSNLQEVRQQQFCQSLKVLGLRDCPVLENLPEGLRDTHALKAVGISRCKNMKISADNLPPFLHLLKATGIDVVDEKMVGDLLRLPTLLFLEISTKFDRYIESYAWKRTPLPFILTENDCDSDSDSKLIRMLECMLGGGGGGEYWRMEGDDDLVREDGHSWQRNNAAVIITGLNLVSQECREAVHRMAEEGREIIYVDTGISRWKRFEAAYEEQGRAFSGEVELNEDDKQMMKGMLKQLQLPKECVPRVWTSPFPKTCLSLSIILFDDIECESGVIKMSGVVEECDEENGLKLDRLDFDEEFSEEYDKERSCQSGEVVALPSLGISDIRSQGLRETILASLEI